MIEHLHSNNSNPKRVVMLGGSGFIGSTLEKRLNDEGIPVLSMSKEQMDLTAPDAVARLTALLKPEDIIIFLSVIGPINHNADALLKNLQMAHNVGRALQKIRPSHLIYASSEAVYAKADAIIDPATLPAPSNLYGIMHLTRELILEDLLADVPQLVLRIAQVYGPGGKINYGPNKFLHTAKQNAEIELFYQGQEHRDFIFINDVVDIMIQAIKNKSCGVVNVATGNSITYADLAQLVQKLLSKTPIRIINNSSSNKSYQRYFDVGELQQAYPEITLTSLHEGIATMLP